VVPAAYRKALGIDVGDEVVVTLEDKEVRVMTLDQAVAHARQLVGRYVPRGRSLAQELRRERRNEAQRE
jgi:bifunctional DNA-binding transcriptional regulator/antitoxin component of YhaV-PrlF toxin-antitoxin module